jgi:phosphoribosylamine-glycine ligase
VSAAGAEREAARELAYRALGRVELDGAQWRGDIGAAPVAAAGGSSCR